MFLTALRAARAVSMAHTRGMSAVAAGARAEVTSVADKFTGDSAPGKFLDVDMSLFQGLESDEAKRALTDLRRAMEENADAVSLRPVEVDWDYWRREIATPGIVDEFKKKWDESKPPNFDKEAAQLVGEVHEEFAPFLAEAERLEAEATELAKWAKAEAEQVQGLIDRLPTLDVDEYLEAHPAIKKRINTEIQEHKWFSV